MPYEVQHHLFGAADRECMRHVADFDAITTWLVARGS
jgi:hypothetical protein